MLCALRGCTHGVLVPSHYLVAGQHLELLVLAQRHEVLLHRQVGRSVAPGQSDLLDCGCHALETLDRQPHKPRLGVGAECDFDPARRIRDACRLRNQCLHAFWESCRIKHAVGTGLQRVFARRIAQQNRFALLHLTAPFMAPDLDLVQSRSELALDRQSVI